jgi:phage-related protein
MTLGDLLDFILAAIIKNPLCMQHEVKIVVPIQSDLSIQNELSIQNVQEFVWREPVIEITKSSAGKDVVLIS